MKQFKEFLKEEFENDIFVAVKFDKYSENLLDKWAFENDIDSIPKEEYHTTVMFSPKNGAPGFKPLGHMKLSVPVMSKFSPEIFEGKTGDLAGNKILVLRYESDWLNRRHEVVKSFGAIPTFPEYKAHITISYNYGGKDISELSPFFGPLLIVEEQAKAIDMKYVNNLAKNNGKN